MLLTLSPLQVQRIGEKRPALGRHLSSLLARPESWLATILVGNTFVNAALAAVGFQFIRGMEAFSASLVPLISVAFVTLVVLLFGEISPKQIAIRHAERFAPLVVGVLRVAIPPLYPLTWCLRRVMAPFRKSLGAKEQRSVSDEELMSVVSLGEDRGLLDLEEGAMVRGILRLSELHASDVMTPRVDLYGLDIHDTPQTHLLQMRRTSYVWIPLWDDSPDKFIDFVDVSKYLLDPAHDLEAARCHYATLVPENIGLDDLLILLYRQRLPMVIVSDEYGGTAGLVSRGDILELLSLETEDELQTEAPEVRPLAKNQWEIAGDASLEQLNFQLGTHLDADDSDRMSGWVMLHAGRIPKAGEVVEADDYRVTVLRMRHRKILSVLLEDLNPASREVEAHLSEDGTVMPGFNEAEVANEEGGGI